MTIIKDVNFTKIAENVKPDSKGRVYLPKIMVKEGITYHIYINSYGQIVLDPQMIIPASEGWLLEKTPALSLAEGGMAESTG